MEIKNFITNLKFIIQKHLLYGKLSLLACVIDIFCDVCSALLGILFPKIVLDCIENNETIPVFLSRLVPALVLFIITSLGAYWAQIVIRRNSDKMRYTCYAKEINDKAISMEYERFIASHEKNIRKKAEISIGDNGESGLNNFLPALTKLFKNIMGFLSYCLIIVALNPWILVMLIVCYFLDGIAAFGVEKWKYKNRERQANIERKLDYMVYKTRDLGAAKDIRLYSMKSWFDKLTMGLWKENKGILEKLKNIKISQLVFEGILLVLRTGVAYIYLFASLLKGNISIGDFSLYFAAITGFGEWLQNIIMIFSELLEANYYVSDYRSFMELNTEHERGEKVTRSDSYTIEFVDVGFKYPESDGYILKNINLTVKTGDKIAIVGYNGAGKTTLIKLLSGLLSPTEGKILLNGTDIKYYSQDEYYKLFSTVFQDIGIIPASISKNIALRPQEDIDVDRVWECLKISGLDKKIHSLKNGIETNLIVNISDGAVALSTGELQKLMMARALYKNAPILILDEPTAALDPIAESEVYRQYEAISENKLSIFISHRLASTKFCNNILLINQGRIAEEGTHQELLALNGLYSRMYHIQSHYYLQSNRE